MSLELMIIPVRLINPAEVTTHAFPPHSDQPRDMQHKLQSFPYKRVPGTAACKDLISRQREITWGRTLESPAVIGKVIVLNITTNKLIDA